MVTAKYPEVIFLPRGEELGGDRVPKMAVYQDSLHRMEERTGQPYDWYMDLDITSPLRTESDIENAFAKKQSRDDLDLVFSVCEVDRRQRQMCIRDRWTTMLNRSARVSSPAASRLRMCMM